MRGDEEIAILADKLGAIDPVLGPVIARRLAYGAREVPDDEYAVALNAFGRKCQILADVIVKQAPTR